MEVGIQVNVKKLGRPICACIVTTINGNHNKKILTKSLGDVDIW